MEERKKSFRRMIGGKFSEESETISSPEVCIIGNVVSIRTQNNRFIRTTKNLTIEQQAFMFGTLFCFHAWLESLFTQEIISLALSAVTFPPHDWASFFLLSFCLPLLLTRSRCQPTDPNVYERLKRTEKYSQRTREHWESEKCSCAMFGECFLEK